MFGLVDFHTHILPAIDDGSSDVQESILMLKQIKSQNASTVIATPHFYANKNSVAQFCTNRMQSVQNLYDYASQQGESLDINLLLGAEVAYYDNISSNEDLDKLCIYGTNTLLLELPFNKLEHTIFNEVSLISIHGITPVIAHCERYLKFKNGVDIFSKLISCGAYIQVNASFFSDAFTRNKAVRLLKNDLIHVLGSDTHGINIRKPNINLAVDVIEKRLSSAYIDQININSNNLLQGAKVIHL